MAPIPAVYENGIFRPIGPVTLPEHSRVEVSLPNSGEVIHGPVEQEVFDILRPAYFSGDPLASEKHNEHNP